MSDKNRECSASTPAFFYAEIYQNGKTEIVDERNLTDWVRKHDKGESGNDGFERLIIHPKDALNSEFSKNTAVFWVNGINTPFPTEIENAAAYARKIHHNVQIIHASTHGMLADALTFLGEKMSIPQSWNNAPEESVALEVLRHIVRDENGLHFKGSVHFASHSRGALIVERGLELVREYLRELKYTDAQIHGIALHITSASFEGASYALIDGVRSVNIVNDDDPVPKLFGVARPDNSRIPDSDGYVSQAATYISLPPPNNVIQETPILNIPRVHDVEVAIARSPASWEDAYAASAQPELLKNAPPKNTESFSAIVLNARGEEMLRFVCDEHFRERGKILSAGKENVTQSPEPGVFIVYRTSDLLHGMSEPDAKEALHRLESASHAHEEVNLSRDDRGLIINGLREKIADAVKIGIREAMKEGREIGEARAKEQIFRFLHPDAIRGTFDGRETRYYPGGLNVKAMVSALDEKHVTLRTSGGLVMMLNRGDLLHNAKQPRALDELLHEAHQAGIPVHMTYMIGGKVNGEEVSLGLYHGHSMRMGM